VNESVAELGGTIGEAILAPTRIYAKAIREVLRRYKVKKIVKAIANVTGGGMVENLPRILPTGCAIEIREETWDMPPIFPFLQKLGNVPKDEMYRVFNMGIGLALVVSPTSTNAIIRTLKKRGEKAWPIGKIVKGAQDVKFVSK
jgi:phosphoribosylformylglycinamidine cyclo-ligase